MRYDAVVVGLGAMGSAALAQLAQRGARVLGIEQFARGHELGASAGRTRIIRKAYFEDPAYVPLLQRAYELWFRLERESGQHVIDLLGVLMVGVPDSAAIAGALRSAREHGLQLDEFDAAALVRRFPGVAPHAGEVGLLEREGGVVFPEAGIAAHLQLAEAAGAQTSFGVAVTSYAGERDGIRLTLADGSRVEAGAVALCAGPWLGGLAVELGLPLRIQRNVQIWFTPSRPDFSCDRFPAFFVDRADFERPLYGFPDFGDGVKAALHGFGDETAPQELKRTVGAADIAPVRRALEAWMPGAATRFASGKACMYALTPDEHFIVDRHPHDARIVIAGGFSGHGYKFAPVIGEIVAQLVLDGGTPQPIGFLRLTREAVTPAR